MTGPAEDRPRPPGMYRDPAEKAQSSAMLRVAVELDRMMAELDLTHAAMLYAVTNWCSSLLASDVARERQHRGRRIRDALGPPPGGGEAPE